MTCRRALCNPIINAYQKQVCRFEEITRRNILFIDKKKFGNQRNMLTPAVDSSVKIEEILIKKLFSLLLTAMALGKFSIAQFIRSMIHQR